jgi:insulin receptor
MNSFSILVCGDVRITLFELRRGLDVHALASCEIILGSVTYAPMHSLTNANTTTITPIRFPYLREVYGYILLGYSSMRSFSSMFPRLSIIHGRDLYHGYSLIIMDNFLLDELGLTSLINIRRGNIIIARNAQLCYAKSLRWNDIMETKQTQIISRQNRENCAFCPTCPSACWSPTQCQQRCSSHCKGNCLSETVCCSAECVGGCYYTNVTTSTGLICNACRNMRIYATGKCVQQCPQTMLKVNSMFLSIISLIM